MQNLTKYSKILSRSSCLCKELGLSNEAKYIGLNSVAGTSRLISLLVRELSFGSLSLKIIAYLSEWHLCWNKIEIQPNNFWFMKYRQHQAFLVWQCTFKINQWQTLMLPPGKKSQFPGSIGSKLSCKEIGGSAWFTMSTLSTAQQPWKLLDEAPRSCCNCKHTFGCLAGGGRCIKWTAALCWMAGLNIKLKIGRMQKFNHDLNQNGSISN